MISLELAGRLRDAGLQWTPVERDVFALPGRDMDDQVFVVSALPALVQRVNGYPVVAFQASAEWALDYVMLADALWLPSEAQLREALHQALPEDALLRLERTAQGYSCTVGRPERPLVYAGENAETAYAGALLAALGPGAAARLL